MNLKICFLVIASLYFCWGSIAQKNTYKKDSVMLRSIYNEALENGRAYEDLRSLCKDIGARLSGSVSAEMAVQWGYNKLKGYDFDTVYFQEVMVPHWERGTKESAYYSKPNGEISKVNILALGGSVPTNGIMQGELVMFKDLKSLQKADKNQIKDK